jgi:hypothetical protein
MTTFEKLVDAIERKLQEVGKNNIDYSDQIDDRFHYDCQGVIESKNRHIDFTFDAFDIGTGYHIDNLVFNSGFALPNITEKLTNYNFKSYGN